MSESEGDGRPGIGSKNVIEIKILPIVLLARDDIVQGWRVI